MNCQNCGLTMKTRIGKYVTVNQCPNSRHREVLEFDEMFLNQKV